VLKKLLRYVLAITIATTGVTVVTAAPALAWGGCNTSNTTVGPCIDYGNSGSQARADFYLNRGPDWSIYYYKLAVIDDGVLYWKVGSYTRLTGTGRYCCWYHNVADLPATYDCVKTRVYIYRADYALHMYADSPTICPYS
jgi:hypothetical protein